MSKDITTTDIERIMQPFIRQTQNARFLPEDEVDNAMDALSNNFENVFAKVEDCGKGVQMFVAGKLAKVHMVPKYKIFIQ